METCCSAVYRESQHLLFQRLRAREIHKGTARSSFRCAKIGASSTYGKAASQGHLLARAERNRNHLARVAGERQSYGSFPFCHAGNDEIVNLVHDL